MAGQDVRLAGVIGWPVSHSRSPALHAYWLRQHGIAGAYVPLPVRPGQEAAAFRGLAALGFAGCNVTVPHKEAALALMDDADALARRIGSVNLVVVRPDGTLHGSSTDGFGFMENLRARAPLWRAEMGPAVVLGAGGSSRAVVAALLDAGCEVRLLNRSRARAEAMAQALGGPIQVIDWDRQSESCQDAGLLVNTTTQGMAGEPPLAIDIRALPPAAVVADLVYVPLLTPLLALARARGHATVDGLGMLLHQARPSFAAWFGVMPDVTDDLRRGIEATL